MEGVREYPTGSDDGEEASLGFDAIGDALGGFFQAMGDVVDSGLDALGGAVDAAVGIEEPPLPPPRMRSVSKDDEAAARLAERKADEERRRRRRDEAAAAQRLADAEALAEAHRVRVERMETIVSKRLASIDYVRRTHTADGADAGRVQPHWLNAARTPRELREAALGALVGAGAASTRSGGGGGGGDGGGFDALPSSSREEYELREHARLATQLQARLRRWFVLCAGSAKLLGLENGIATLQAASQLFAEFEFWTSTPAVRGMKLMLAASSGTGLFPVSEVKLAEAPSAQRHGSILSPRSPASAADDGASENVPIAVVHAVLHRHHGSVAYVYLPTPRVSCGRLDYATLVLSLCDVVGQLYSKLGDAECAEAGAFDALLALDRKIEKHVFEPLVEPLQAWAIATAKRSLGALTSRGGGGGRGRVGGTPPRPPRGATPR